MDEVSVDKFYHPIGPQSMTVPLICIQAQCLLVAHCSPYSFRRATSMWEYIVKALANGFIRPSTSLAGAGFIILGANTLH